MQLVRRQYKYIGLCLLSCFSVSAAEPIVASSNDFIAFFLPDKYAQIDAALMAAELEIEHTILPVRRSLFMLSRGEIAIDTYRTPVAVADTENIVQLRPAVDSAEFWLVAASPERCEEAGQAYHNHSIVGIRGIRLFDSIYPAFKQYSATKNFSSAWKMLQAEHAYFSIWPRAVIEHFKEHGELVYTCGEKPYARFDFYSYINKDYAWAIPALERSYRQVFK